MPRVKRGTSHIKKRRNLLKKAKGYKWGRKSKIKQAKTAVKKADTALKSETAKEAKRMGIQAWGVAKTALGSAIKSAKSVIEPKDK